jgi:predicted Fe-Mo cluster-binding NifX family protein
MNSRVRRKVKHDLENQGQISLFDILNEFSYQDIEQEITVSEIKGITGELFDWQKAPTDALKKLLLDKENVDYLHHRAFFIFGEVGVGKTYISSYLAKEWEGVVKIIAPETTHKNWKSCLNLFGVDNAELVDDLNFEDFLDTNPEEILVIVDEIHKKVKDIEWLSKFSRFVNANITLLGLTGTPFEKEVNVFAKAAIVLANYEPNRLKKDQVITYLTTIVPYHGISLSKPTLSIQPHYIVKAKEVAIDMSYEQRAFYDFIVSRTSKLHVSDFQLAKATDEFVDFGDTETFFTKREEGRYFVGYKAEDDDKNLKVEALKNEAENSSGKILVFVNTKKALNFLKNEGFDVLTFEDKTKTEELIHAFYEENDLLVVCTTEVKEGINLNEVDTVIWYQTPKNAVDFTQCNGRMLRGIPKEDTYKNVIQIFSHNTIQEKIANQLAAIVSGNNISIASESSESWESRLTSFLKNVLSM